MLRTNKLYRETIAEGLPRGQKKVDKQFLIQPDEHKELSQ